MSSISKCPNCGKPTVKELAPFCSKRCKDVDLARWFRGDYSIPVIEGNDMPDSEDEESPNLQ